MTTLSKTNPTLKSENRSQLFFNEYKYSIKCSVPFGYILRGCTQPSFNTNSIRERLIPRFNLLKNSKRLFNDCGWTKELAVLTEDEIESRIMQVYHLLNQMNYTLRIQYTSDQITIYANDLNLIDNFKYAGLEHYIKTITEAEVSIPKGTIFRKNSQYKYRVFFKSRSAIGPLGYDLTQFFKTYKDHVSISKSLDFCLKFSSSQTIERHHYFDTNEISMTQVFELIAPGLISRQCRIISDKYCEGD